MNRNDDGAIKIAFALCAFGFVVFKSSLKNFKLRRRMADIPKSQIASAAIGRNVEIHAKVLCLPEEQILSPLTSKRAAAYVWDFQELVKRGKSSSWETQKMFYSSPFLYVTDASQAIAAVDLASCEFQEDIFSSGTVFNNRSLDISDDVKEILREKDMLDTSQTASFFTQRKFRIREGLLNAGSELYILGTGHSPPQTEKTLVTTDTLVFGTRQISLRDRISKAFKQQLQNSKTIAQFDKNKDGVLDKAEKDAVYMALEKKALSISAAQKTNNYLSQTKILFSLDKGADEFMKLDKVYVSTSREDKASSTLAGKAYLGLIGGPLMIVAGVLVLYDDIFN
jgi:hypothetical protein